DHNMRLNVHNIWLHGGEHPASVILRSPRPHEPQPTMRIPPNARQSIHDYILAFDRFISRRRAAPTHSPRDNKNFMPALHQTGSETLSEASCPVDVWSESVAANQNTQRLRALSLTHYSKLPSIWRIHGQRIAV